LVMNHLIYVYVLSHPPHPHPRDFFFHFSSLYICEYVCVRLCAYISFPARVCPHHNYWYREYLVWCIVIVYQSFLLIVYAILGPWFG
jgi:hypothetical protein